MKKETKAGYRQIVVRLDENFYKKMEKLRSAKYPFLRTNAFIAFILNERIESEIKKVNKIIVSNCNKEGE